MSIATPQLTLRAIMSIRRYWSTLPSDARRWLIALAALYIGSTATVAAFAGYLLLTGNFHEVVPGELYRSAQPSTATLESATSRYGLKTVINLRGASPGASWYRNEVEEAKRLGLTHIDFRMRSDEELTPERANQLLHILAAAEKPILVHCRSGTDRTGLAAALYLAGIKKVGEEPAEHQLSLAFGHFSVPATGPFAMDETFEMMEPQFGYAGS